MLKNDATPPSGTTKAAGHQLYTQKLRVNQCALRILYEKLCLNYEKSHSVTTVCRLADLSDQSDP